MVTQTFRRAALVSAATGAVVSGMVLTGVPVSAASHHAGLPGKTRTFASLSQVSVAPHSTTAFALGSQSTGSTSSNLVLRRTGSHWSKLKVKGATGASLVSIAAGSPKSAWIVGSVFNGGEQGLILHSKGGTFTKMKTHAAGGALQAVAASSAKYAWAVGSGVGGGFVIHWNGHKWAPAKLPKSASTDSFNAVSVAGKAVWLLGQGTTGPVVAHGTGHRFTVKPVHVPTGGSVSSIAAASAKSAWLAGNLSVKHGSSFVTHTLVLHGNGKKWAKIKTPSPFPTDGLVSITAVGKRAYAVGSGGKISSPKGLDTHALAIAITGKHAKNQHVSAAGKTSGFAHVSASSKAAVAVGASYNGFLCGPHSLNVVSSPLAAALHGRSWRHQSTPKLRRAGAASYSASAVPAIPAC
jgi:hypothetical protein